MKNPILATTALMTLALLLYAPGALAQNCAAEIKPLKPIAATGKDAVLTCFCNEGGTNCRWAWTWPQSQSQPQQPAVGVDARIPLMVQPPPPISLASPSFLGTLIQIQTLRSLEQQRQMMERRRQPPSPPAGVTDPFERFGLSLGLDAQLACVVRIENPCDLPANYPGDEQFELFVTVLKHKQQLLKEESARREKSSTPESFIPDPPRAATSTALAVSPEEAIQREALIERWAAKVVVARKRYSDYDAVLGSADAGKLLLTPSMVQALLESDYGADLAYWLGKHPEECRRIAALSPASGARELGRIEAGISATLK